MIAICATCGADLTVVDEEYDCRDIMMPLISVSVAPCCTCMCQAACQAEGERGKDDE
jgi:hypothetical protein